MYGRVILMIKSFGRKRNIVHFALGTTYADDDIFGSACDYNIKASYLFIEPVNCGVPSFDLV